MTNACLYACPYAWQVAVQEPSQLEEEELDPSLFTIVLGIVEAKDVPPSPSSKKGSPPDAYELSAHDLAFRAQGWVQGLGFRVQGSGFRFQGLGHSFFLKKAPKPELKLFMMRIRQVCGGEGRGARQEEDRATT